ncbi:DsrE/DsrF-like family protein [bacterium BMS3Abin07]|nr:DsrE/DsrF-like family protein [bacterium BMS3Abin07]GBE31606.1 DsrE/DsrF-like family protein [bacterium BMS3Bbin05]HDO21718.1 hypothetical protein [Nitrospirota bacterium]HDZ87073.1 hypothetical protein [Nitrospirota bacterium]
MNTDGKEKLFVVVNASGFNNMGRVKTALMFATVAAGADYRSVLYTVQDGVDIMIKGEIGKHEKCVPGSPSLSRRLNEALDAGVEILCCSQAVKNKGVEKKDLITGVGIAGAMTLIQLTAQARGILTF